MQSSFFDLNLMRALHRLHSLPGSHAHMPGVSSFHTKLRLGDVRFTTHQGATARPLIRYLRPGFDTLFCTRANLYYNRWK